MSNLKNMKYFSEDVGRGIKSTVHEYRWEFTIEERNFCIQLFIYLISNIRKVVYNQEVLKEEHGGPNNTYSYEFYMDGHHFKIIQTYENLTQLLIDGESFDYNYTLERNKKEFDGSNNGKVCDIYTKEDDDVIQASNEIKFIKREKPKQILNLSIGIKNNNILNKKQNNLNKFKFDSGENIKINQIEKNKNINNSNTNNLIDFNNDFDDDLKNNDEIKNFDLNYQNQQNRYNNMIDEDKYNLNNFNFNYNNGINNNKYQNNNFNNQNTNNYSNYLNNCNGNNMNNEKNFNNNNNQNNNFYNSNYNFDMNNNNNNFNQNNNNYNNFNNNLNTNFDINKNIPPNNINYSNQNDFNNNMMMINPTGNRNKNYKNIDISYYGF